MACVRGKLVECWPPSVTSMRIQENLLRAHEMLGVVLDPQAEVR